MQLKPTNIKDLFIVERQRFADQRGSFERLFCSDTLRSGAEFGNLAQANLSRTSNAGVVRGMHLQTKPKCEKKLVSCIQGRVFDVAVDLRRNSPTFLNHFSIELDGQDSISILIPEGVAHGFQTLTGNTDMVYFHSHNYSPENELGFNALDPTLNIDWPLKVSSMSDKDAKYEFITSKFSGLKI